MKNDGLINRLWQLKKKQWYRGPELQALDEQGRRLYFRSGDLAARLCLNGEAVAMTDEGKLMGTSSFANPFHPVTWPQC